MSISYRILLASLLIIPPSYAAPSSCGSLDEVRWLLGDWRSEDGEKLTFESWQQVSQKTFEGDGIVRSKTDNHVLSSESLRLVEMSGAVFYLAKVAHNQYAVAFKLTSCSDDTLVFENPKHDFPRRLEYQRHGTNRIVVEVSDGAAKGFQITFVRDKGS